MPNPSDQRCWRFFLANTAIVAVATLGCDGRDHAIRPPDAHPDRGGEVSLADVGSPPEVGAPTDATDAGTDMTVADTTAGLPDVTGGSPDVVEASIETPIDASPDKNGSPDVADASG